MKTSSINFKFRRRLLFSFLAVNLLLATGYLYLVNNLVLTAAAYEHHQNESERLAAELALLESQFTKKAATITMDYAYSLGFEDATSRSLFAYRTPASSPFISATALSLAQSGLVYRP